MSKINVILLGSTGAIGSMCLDVLKGQEQYRLVTITANKNKTKLDNIQKDFNVPHSFIVDAKNKNEVENITNTLIGKYNPKDTIVINAIQGSSGLNFSESFIEHGFDLYLANKETVVCGGRKFMEKAKRINAKIVPLDTEMVALSHLIAAFEKENIAEYIITASGGPFRNYAPDELKKVTYDKAVKHPVWKMGEEISVDSATLLNKALEIAEASVLFDIEPSKIKVLLHPESFIHSLVRLQNGILYAELYTPDQRTALRDALGLKEEIQPFTSLPELTFEEAKGIPALELGYEATRSINKARAIVEAKEEAFVLFKQGKIRFDEIVPFVQHSIN